MDGPTQTAKEHKEPSDMDGSTKELKTDSTKELKTDSTVEELKNGSPVRRSLALYDAQDRDAAGARTRAGLAADAAPG